MWEPGRRVVLARGWLADFLSWGVLLVLVPAVAFSLAYRPDLAARISPSFTGPVLRNAVELSLVLGIPLAALCFFVARPQQRTIDWASGRVRAGLRSAPLDAVTAVELRSGSYAGKSSRRWYHRVVLQLDPERAGRAELRFLHVEDTPYDDTWSLVCALAAALKVPAKR